MDTPRRRALAALLIVVPAPSLGAVAAFWLLPGPVGGALYAVGKAVLYGLPVLWHLAVDRHPPSWSPPRRGGFATAAGLGIAMSLAILAAHALLRDRLDPSLVRSVVSEAGLGTPARFAGFAAYLCLVNSLLEEYAFRWFIFTRCARLMTERLAVLAAGLAFTAHHVIVLRAVFDWPVTGLASVGVLAGGLAWSWCYARFRSIWPGYLSHLLVDITVLTLGWRLAFAGAAD